MRGIGLVVALLSSYCFALTVDAHDVISCPSPDGNFALRCVYADKQPYNGESTIVEMPARKSVLVLDPNWTLGKVKLVWSKDSQHVAYFAEKGYNYATRVFFRSGDLFNEIALPQLPEPKLPPNATASADSETRARTEPMNWNPSGDLLIEKELLNRDWGRAALKITLGFDQENRPSVRSSEQKKVSVIDYFLLLPPENFEASPADLLQIMRMGGFFQQCDGEQHETNVDEKNGYMTGGGDGAQSSFAVALFRYRDGRPLLALCDGEEPELGKPGLVYLKFFELGADGKMHEAKRSIFPIPDSDDRWQFDLPRKGKVVVVRARKSKKILHKITWNGEKFEEQK